MCLLNKNRVLQERKIEYEWIFENFLNVVVNMKRNATEELEDKISQKVNKTKRKRWGARKVGMREVENR